MTRRRRRLRGPRAARARDRAPARPRPRRPRRCRRSCTTGPSASPRPWTRSSRSCAGRHDRVAVAYADCGSYGALDAALAGSGIERLAATLLRPLRLRRGARGAAPRSRARTSSPTSSPARSSTRSWRSLGLDRYPELRDDYFHSYRRCVWLAQRPTPALRTRRRARGRAARPAAERARRRRGRAGTRAGAHLQRSGGMKERADVVVIGAGIVGCSAAHYLTLAGAAQRRRDRPGADRRHGRLVVPRPRAVLPDERLEALVHARAVVGRPLSRARHARAPHLVGGRLARGRDHAGAARRDPAPATRSPRRGASRAT